MVSKILVTGGAGYIGSHTVLQLLLSNYSVIVLDNLENSSVESLKRVCEIADKKIEFVEGDVRDKKVLNKLFSEYHVESVIHFAGLKAVGDSVINPIEYYDNNVIGTVQLIKVMQQHNVKNIVFSSSATVYGDPLTLPLHEDMPPGFPTNPYGKSKLIIEGLLGDLYRSDTAWNIVNLRYFNPVGAHDSGKIGEDPRDTPNNLMPVIAQIAAGKRERLFIFGGDYQTHDGTGVRDYIHVVDLAEGHLKALEKISREPGFYTVNLGTGVGYSVLDMVRAFSSASGVRISYEIVPRRLGDVATCHADPKYASECLGWKPRKGLQEMCEDTWRWNKNNPNGYK